MPAPPTQRCTVPDCDYSTPEGIPTWDMLTTHLKLHSDACHNDSTGGSSTAPSKTAKKERPTISNQMSEESWRFFLDEWGRYKRQTGIKGQELLDELWGCQVEELRQLAFAEGGTANLDTEDAVVKKLNPLPSYPYTPQFMLSTFMNSGSSQTKMSTLLQPVYEVLQPHVGYKRSAIAVRRWLHTVKRHATM